VSVNITRITLKMEKFDMPQNILRIVLLVFLSIVLFGCKSSDEKLIDACISKLDKELVTWAKYDGWSLGKAQGRLHSFVPAVEMNENYKTDQFYNFEVIVTDFTVKNGFNADVKSFYSCTGHVSKDSDGEFDPPMELLINVTLNGNKLGL
jgi:hypothetical protein